MSCGPDCPNCGIGSGRDCAATPRNRAATSRIGSLPLSADDDIRATHCPDERYAALWAVLMEAFAQASSGKGAERHGTPERYEDQPTAFLARHMGSGGPAFQAAKKLIEAQGMERRELIEAANRERLGAIVYAAFAVIESRRAQ